MLAFAGENGFVFHFCFWAAGERRWRPIRTSRFYGGTRTADGRASEDGYAWKEGGCFLKAAVNEKFYDGRPWPRILGLDRSRRRQCRSSSNNGEAFSSPKPAAHSTAGTGTRCRSVVLEAEAASELDSASLILLGAGYDAEVGAGRIGVRRAEAHVIEGVVDLKPEL